MRTLSWVDIFRLGCVQTCLGAIVVLTTSTLNRLMVVELALPAVLPGFLVALYYGIQITRPNWGFRSDTRGNRSFFIIGGMIALAFGALVAAFAIDVLERFFELGLAISIFAYGLIGIGVGASGTSLLALLATATKPIHRAAAATITWLMMIAGIAVTAAIVGQFLDPYSHSVLIRVVFIIAMSAVIVTSAAIWGIERRVDASPQQESTSFMHGLREIWAEQKARHFTIFVFLSMSAYFMQELILEPYSGLVFDFTPGQSTTLSGVQNGGVFLGMVLVGIMVTGFRLGTIKFWVIFGCFGSSLMLGLLAWMGQIGPNAPLTSVVTGLGFFNGIFAVAAIGTMMALAGQGRKAREGTRMGLWGAAQALAAGFGGLIGAASVDIFRQAFIQDSNAFGIVFLLESLLFVIAALMAMKVIDPHNIKRHSFVPGE